MKTLLLVVVSAVIALTVPTQTAAYYGSLGVYSDVGGCDCNILDEAAGLVTVYVVHRDIATGVSGARFKVDGTARPYLTFIAENPLGDPIFILGNIEDGYDVSYGACVTGGLPVMEILFFGSGLSPHCSNLGVVAAPTSTTGQVEVFDCDHEVFPTTGYSASVNPGTECVCFMPIPCIPVPVEGSTWGAIKALYR